MTIETVVPEIKPKRIKKAKVAVVETVPVVETVVETEPVVETEVETVSFEDKAKEILNSLDFHLKELKTLKASFKDAMVIYQKELRETNKKNKKKNRKPSNGQPHGFAKSSLLSDDLCDLLSLEHGSELPPPTVTSMIANYVRVNDLYIPEIKNKSVFKCDAKLLKVLGKPKYLASKKDESLGTNHSYWNLQTTMKDNGHYIRQVKV